MLEKKYDHKKDKKNYEKPELTRHEKLTWVTTGSDTSVGFLGCTRS